MTRVTALVAARNEAERIGATVSALARLADRVLVVDDGSSDGTGDVAASAGATVIISGQDIGKGSALELGLAGATDIPDIWVLADGDLGDTASALDSVLAPVLEGEADLAIAALPRQGGGFGLVKRFARWGIGTLAGFQATEPLSGQRAVTAEALEACRPIAHGFGAETAMTIDAIRLGFRVVEVPADIRHRATGRDLAGFAHRGRQGWDITRAILARALGVR